MAMMLMGAREDAIGRQVEPANLFFAELLGVVIVVANSLLMNYHSVFGQHTDSDIV